jgi:hypothetical protein
MNWKIVYMTCCPSVKMNYEIIYGLQACKLMPCYLGDKGGWSLYAIFGAPIFLIRYPYVCLRTVDTCTLGSSV